MLDGLMRTVVSALRMMIVVIGQDCVVCRGSNLPRRVMLPMSLGDLVDQAG
jgi:hypothetical protein